MNFPAGSKGICSVLPSTLRSAVIGAVAFGAVLLAGCTGAAALEPVHGAPLAASGAVEPSALDANLQPIVRGPPRYPRMLRSAGVTGVAVIDFVIGTDGRVNNATVLDATTVEFGDAARTAVLGWRFKPATRHGEPVSVHMRVPISFTLNRA